MATITVDGRTIEAQEGANLLNTCLKNGIYIPNLCYLEKEATVAASCRMCFVQVRGDKGPTTACTVRVVDGMSVQTDTEPVRHLQRAGLELLLSVHDVSCKTCPANRKCALQDLARFLKVRLKAGGQEKRLKTPAVIHEHRHLDYYPNRCVLCGRCVTVCRSRNGQAQLAFARRGFQTTISSFAGAEVGCADCLACSGVCPVGALVPNNGAAVKEPAPSS